MKHTTHDGGDLNKAVFLCSLPPITTAIKAGGDGMRVQFDIPESEAGESVKLFMMKNKQLKVTVECVPYQPPQVEHQEFEEPYADLISGPEEIGGRLK
ncbi:MAG: hypothetical protein AAF902_01990 [Chloroflexota bacterium]